MSNELRDKTDEWDERQDAERQVLVTDLGKLKQQYKDTGMSGRVVLYLINRLEATEATIKRLTSRIENIQAKERAAAFEECIKRIGILMPSQEAWKDVILINLRELKDQQPNN